MRLLPVVRRATQLPALSLFDDFLNSFYNDEIKSGSRLPAMDVEENEQSFIVKADLPGVKKEDLKISLQNGQLILNATTCGEKEDRTYHRRERWCGTYQRVLGLPDNCRSEGIQANLENGLLTLIIPKAEPKPKQEIPVN